MLLEWVVWKVRKPVVIQNKNATEEKHKIEAFLAEKVWRAFISLEFVFREKIIFSIDPETARDLDDALSIEKCEDVDGKVGSGLMYIYIFDR